MRLPELRHGTSKLVQFLLVLLGDLDQISNLIIVRGGARGQRLHDSGQTIQSFLSFHRCL